MSNDLGDKQTPAAGTEAAQRAGELVRRLHEGRLTSDEQQRLAAALDELPEDGPAVIAATEKVSFSGPLPHPEVLNQYSEEARSVILRMAEQEQAHTHRIREAGLEGAVNKDRRGQWIGGGIAIAGLVVAAIIVPYSVVGASVIGALDLFGMVALFVAPRVLDRRAEGVDEESDK